MKVYISAPSNASGQRTFGFSLIETVIALGIMGLAVTALLGLLPHGMEMTKKAANAGAQSRILDTIKSDLAHFSFGQLAAITKEKLTFDDEGILLGVSDSASLVAYVAEVSNIAQTKARGITLPGGEVEPLLVSMVVKIANTPVADFSFDTESPSSYVTIPLHLGPNIP